MLVIPTLAHGGPARALRSEGEPGAISPAEDPVVLARRWESLGFRRMHLRELDDAGRRGETAELVGELTRQNCLPLQVESPALDASDVEALLDLGADLVVSGTRGSSDPAWLEELAARAPGRVSLLVDLRGGRTLQRGRELRRDLFDLLDELAPAPLAAIVTRAAAPATRLQPAELTRLEEIVSCAAWPVVTLGTVVSLVELRNLEERGISAVVLPADWDHEALDPRAILEEFAAER